MDKRTIILIITVFVLIVAGMFTFAYLKKTELAEPTAMPTNVEEIETPYASITRIDAKHFFINGKHTFVGSVEVPTPCDLLTAESEVRESMPEQVELKFSIINNSENCVQAITDMRFKVEANASKEAVITASFMGRKVELNLIPAQSGETPDEFELYIKG